MLGIIGNFISSYYPELKVTTEPVPDEYETLMQDWKRAQDEFGQWAILSRMAGILSTLDCYLDVLPTTEDKRVFIRHIGEQRSEWLQMPDLEQTGSPAVADEYKALIDEWEQVEPKLYEWQLREIPAVGSG